MLLSQYTIKFQLILYVLLIAFIIKNKASVEQLHLHDDNTTDPNEDEEGLRFFHIYLQFRFKQSKLGLQTYSILNKVPEIYHRFDWILHGRDHRWKAQQKTVDPRTVLAHVDLLKKDGKEFFMYQLWKLRPVKGNHQRVLAFVGGDVLTSAARETLEMLVKVRRFSSIWYEGVDVRIPGISTVPSGLNGYYLARCGLRNVVQAVRRSDTYPLEDKLLACVSFGVVCWNFDTQPNRKALIEFVNTSAWVKRSFWPADRYWDELLKHKFMLAPHGNGLQSAKFFECMMVRVVPVTVAAPAFEDLRAMGFPLVLVQQWSDVTPELLDDWYETQGRAVNWTWVRGLLEVDRVMDMMLQG